MYLEVKMKRIKELLFKLLFPQFYQEYESFSQIIINQKRRINLYENNSDRYAKVFEAIKRDNVQVLGVEQNKKGEWVLVAKKMVCDDMWIVLYSPTYLAINNHPRIMSTTHKCEATAYYNAENYVKIDDVLMQDNSIGNGSICMKYFIKEVKSQGFDYISGWLSSVDKENFTRSIPFYKKFGFDVFMGKENNGSIKLELNKDV